jgi:hypothetical protein
VYVAKEFKNNMYIHKTLWRNRAEQNSYQKRSHTQSV